MILCLHPEHAGFHHIISFKGKEGSRAKAGMVSKEQCLVKSF
jgi:hypothetical protein